MMKFRVNQAMVWRYDRQCMFPANYAADEVAQAFQSVLEQNIGNNIDWSQQDAVVLANWQVLHGRGAEPPDERERTLEGNYVG
jgi:hypothetical protein